VSDREAFAAYAAAVAEHFGRVNVVINNAGVALAGNLADLDYDDMEWIVGINFWGVVYGCKFFLPYLKQADEAHIVNLSSLFGLIGVPTQTSYCATKFAVRGLSEALWVELKDLNIGVTSVHPGGVRTNIAKSARSEGAALKSRAIDVIDRFSVSPERCARQIVGAIKKNKMRQLVTRETHFVDVAKRLSAVLPQRLLLAGYRRQIQGKT
jgi:short-subunit dehydrogenase